MLIFLQRGLQVFDNLASRLGDGNSKVNLMALDVTNEVIPYAANEIQSMLHVLVRPLQYHYHLFI